MKFGNAVVTKTYECVLRIHGKKNKRITGQSNLAVQESQKYMKLIYAAIAKMPVCVHRAHENPSKYNWV